MKVYVVVKTDHRNCETEVLGVFNTFNRAFNEVYNRVWEIMEEKALEDIYPSDEEILVEDFVDENSKKMEIMKMN